MASYLDLVGAPPNPDSIAFLGWVNRLADYRRNECDFPRTGPVRYLKAGGGGTFDGTSDANAFATLAQAETWLSGLSAGDITAGPTLLIKRGDTIRLTAGMTVPCDNLRVGSYGDPDAAAPILSFGTILIEAENANWVEVNNGTDAKNAWYIELADVDANPGSYTAPGWIWDRNDPLNPYAAAGSLANCEDTPRSFWWDSGNSRLYVNPGYFVEAWKTNTLVEAFKFSPADVAYDVTGDVGSNNFPVCFLSPTSPNARTKLLFEQIEFRGWGCSALNFSSTAGIKIMSGNESAVYIRDCVEYYAGRHCMSLEVGGTDPGGRLIMERCRAGYTNEVENGATVLNCYAPGGGWECLHIDCDVDFGALPDTQPSSYGGKAFSFAHGECAPYLAYFAHSSPGNDGNVYISLNSRISDRRAEYPYATSCYWRSGFTVDDLPGDPADPLTWRVYWIGFQNHDKPPSRPTTNWAEATGTGVGSGNKCWLINSHITLWKRWNAGNNVFMSRPCNWVWLNCWLDLIDETTVTGRLITGQNNTDLYWWWIGGGARLRGRVSGTTRVAIGNRYSGNFRLANLLLVSPDKPLALQSSTFLAGGEIVVENSPSFIQHIAAFGGQDANTGNPTGGGAAGFDQAPGFLNLDTLAAGRRIRSNEQIGPDNLLYRAGVLTPFSLGFGAARYDGLGRPRGTVPSIGRTDVVTASLNESSAHPLVFQLVF